eukprot:TRINITY_DN1143_c0_g1_i6.p1 TRINITY_DN1143_c0_g1~~TRINITY_DN1143_c0_g1_i6.p1  ORF type:complete len:165 (+),score=32.88 TRINITY_DN1143_c0_g1_i6:40-534(+)
MNGELIAEGRNPTRSNRKQWYQRRVREVKLGKHLQMVDLIPFIPTNSPVFQRAKKFLNERRKTSSTLSVLLAGHVDCCTSLLFHYTYLLACEGKRVIFIANKRRIQSSLTIFPEDFQPRKEILEKIEILNVEDGLGLRTYFANIHLSHELPHLIVVDDFSGIVG